MFALFDDVGFGELLVVAVAGILFFGRRLPEVASQAGAQLVKLRRSLQDLKNETGVDHEVRKIQRSFQDAIPRDLSVTDMARLASSKMTERIEATRKEITEGIEKPLDPAAPANGSPPAPVNGSPAALTGAQAQSEPVHDAARVGPPASDATIARTREGLVPAPPPSAPAEAGTSPDSSSAPVGPVAREDELPDAGAPGR